MVTFEPATRAASSGPDWAMPTTLEMVSAITIAHRRNVVRILAAVETVSGCRVERAAFAEAAAQRRLNPMFRTHVRTPCMNGDDNIPHIISQIGNQRAAARSRWKRPLFCSQTHAVEP